MRVFVAGSTGAVGIPTVRALRAAGHDVFGLTRSPAKVALLESLGAQAVVGDVFSETLVDQLTATKPDAVVQLLTALPEHGPTRLPHLRETNRLRRDATRVLIGAAGVAGVKRYVSESIVFCYGYGDHGDHVFTENDPAVRSMEGMEPEDDALDAIASLEDHVTGSGGMALRFGLFYGPETGSTKFMTSMIRKHLFMLPGGGHGVTSWIHVDDAAAAVVCALDGGAPGALYNIVDDEPARLADFTNEMARVLGAKPPRNVPLGVSRAAAPYITSALTTVLRVSNARAKRELGWRPRYPTYREGLRTLVLD